MFLTKIKICALKLDQTCRFLHSNETCSCDIFFFSGRRKTDVKHTAYHYFSAKQLALEKKE